MVCVCGRCGGSSELKRCMVLWWGVCEGRVCESSEVHGVCGGVRVHGGVCECVRAQRGSMVCEGL